MTDFFKAAQSHYPGAKWTLLGFSSGGGFAVRIAAEPLGHSFDRYVLISPFLVYTAPTVRTANTEPSGKANGEAAAWSTACSGRIFGLVLLDNFGIHSFDGLPVLNEGKSLHPSAAPRRTTIRAGRFFGRALLNRVIFITPFYIRSCEEINGWHSS
jgi:alpha-beta hydrolase superfamily lysophospholipase